MPPLPFGYPGTEGSIKAAQCREKESNLQPGFLQCIRKDQTESQLGTALSPFGLLSCYPMFHILRGDIRFLICEVHAFRSIGQRVRLITNLND